MGPAAEDLFGEWARISNMDAVSLQNWVALLMCVGPEGGLWLD